MELLAPVAQRHVNLAANMDTDRLIALIDAKHTVLSHLHDLAQRQFALASERDAAGLVSLLAAKQKLLDALSALEERLDPFREQDPQARLWKSPAERARCASVAENCRNLLDEIMALDQRGMKLLKDRQQATLATIHAAHDAAHARSAYVQEQPVPTTRPHFDLA
jgi:hypothetical protein